MSLVDKSVLLIDDDPELRKIAEKILTNMGISVFHASTVNEAFAVIKNKCPHVIITDLNMEPESGFDFLQKFKEDPTVGKIPVIVLSARTGRESIHKAIALGAKEYLTKPIEANKLIQKIRKMVRSNEFSSLEFFDEKMPKMILKIPATIVGGSEKGLRLETPVRLLKDSSVTIESTLLNPMGFEKPPILRTGEKTMRSSRGGGFINEVRFLGLLEAQLNTIRGIIERWHSK